MITATMVVPLGMRAEPEAEWRCKEDCEWENLNKELAPHWRVLHGSADAKLRATPTEDAEDLASDTAFLMATIATLTAWIIASQHASFVRLHWTSGEKLEVRTERRRARQIFQNASRSEQNSLGSCF